MGGTDDTVSGGAPRVRVFGAVEVDGRAVTRRQAALLSALALAPGSVVGSEELISAVWPVRVPDTARASLQNQVARLRAEFGRDLIRSDRRGYELVASTDVVLFDRLVATDLRGLEPSRRLAVLAEALELYRGRPFGALEDNPAADAESARLEAVRGETWERLARGLMAAEAHDEAVAELERLVESTPFDERRWELLMRAEVEAGRPARALAAFVRVERLLAAELATAPCERLVLLRDAIATGRHAPAPGRAASPADPTVPSGDDDGVRRIDLRGAPGPEPAVGGTCGGAPTRLRSRCAQRTQRTTGGAS